MVDVIPMLDFGAQEPKEHIQTSTGMVGHKRICVDTIYSTVTNEVFSCSTYCYI